MKRFSPVPNIVIQREQLRVFQQNLRWGVLLYSLIVILTAYLISIRSGNDSRIIIWAGVLLLLNLVGAIRFLFFLDRPIDNPRRDGALETIMATFNGIIFSLLPILFIPSASPEIIILIIFACAGLAAGGVNMQASWLPVFFGFNIPHLVALIITLALREEAVYHGLAVGITLLTLALSVFAVSLHFTLLGSTALRFENDGLIGKLRTALTQTDEANRAKSVFLASASHDLRQPLHALGLLTETLASTKLNAQQTEIQDHMMSAVESTRSMLDSLLNISKLDAGAISSEPKPFLVQTLFNKLESELAPIADENGLIYRARETIAAAHSDAFIVELILRNLIANAIRYTNEGGLLVGCRVRTPNRLVIEVWDTGVGIPAEKIDDIFREFKQLKNPERDARKGFGLGLAIAQGLAKTLDTLITVNSEAGKGSVFRFELPASDAEVIEDFPRHLSPTDFTGRTVLIIDDDPRIRASMHSLMLSWNCNSKSAESASEALSIIDGVDVDIMLVDYRLREGKTGRDAIDDLRAHTGRHIPAIIITGDTGAERIADAQAADALLLHKPASSTQLHRMMRNLLSDDQ